MANKVWVFVDQFKGQALSASWEVIAVGRKLADQLGSGVTAVVIGGSVEALAAPMFHYGADDVVVAEDASLEDYRAGAYTSVRRAQSASVAM